MVPNHLYCYSKQRHIKSQSSSKGHSWFRWYAEKLDTHPLLTKGLTSGIIAGSGDVICQSLDKEQSWDILRSCRFFLMGSLWVAPITHVWYGALSMRLLPGPASALRVTQRVIVDQFGFAPIFLPTFMTWLWVLEGRDNIQEQLIQTVPEMIVAGWTLWIPAMTINFAVVPIKYQVLFSNMVALLWNVYLSYKSASTKKTSLHIDQAVAESSSSSPPPSPSPTN